MSIQDTLRRVARENALDARVATVSTQRFTLTFVDGQWVRTPVGDVELRSEQYAVAFVRKYNWDEQQIKQIFGAQYDLEDLQYEMLDVVYKAADTFLKAGGEGNWKAYLSHCLKTRLWRLGTTDKRVAVHNPKTMSLQVYLQHVLDIDDYTGDTYAEMYPEALTVEDAYQQIVDLNQARVFLETLTARQRTIILMRWEHVPNGKKESGTYNKDIAQKLGISGKTLTNELLRIKRAFREYAEDKKETSWLAYLKRLDNRRRNAREV